MRIAATAEVGGTVGQRLARIDGSLLESDASSDAITFDGRLWIGGQLPLGQDGEMLHRDDVAAQTRLVMGRVKQLLERVGGSLADLAKVTVHYRVARTQRTCTQTSVSVRSTIARQGPRRLASRYRAYPSAARRSSSRRSPP